MPRPEKVQAVADIKARLEGANAVFLAEYSGLSVQDQQALRRSLRKNGAEFKVVKMTLARRAAADLDIDSLDDLLLGPTGLAFADGDAVLAAKALRDFAKDHDVFSIKGGLLGRDFLPPERVADLADIESREALLARILGALQGPMANLAGLFAALPRGMATAIQQLIDKRPFDGPADVEVAEEDADAGDESEGVAPAEAASEPDDAPGEPTADESSDEQADTAEEE